MNISMERMKEWILINETLFRQYRNKNGYRLHVILALYCNRVKE